MSRRSEAAKSQICNRRFFPASQKKSASQLFSAFATFRGFAPIWFVPKPANLQNFGADIKTTNSQSQIAGFRKEAKKSAKFGGSCDLRSAMKGGADTLLNARSCLTHMAIWLGLGDNSDFPQDNSNLYGVQQNGEDLSCARTILYRTRHNNLSSPLCFLSSSSVDRLLQ